jgi:hypothetical protein
MLLDYGNEAGEKNKGVEELLSPRSQVSLRSNPSVLYARWELSEPSGFPFRRWTTKQTVRWTTPEEDEEGKSKGKSKGKSNGCQRTENQRRTLRIEGPSVVLQPPMEPMLRVLPTSFLGNPNDPLLQYPVAEEIQAAIDLDFVDERELPSTREQQRSIAPDHKDGSFLVLGPRNSELIQNIGDPYPGADKILRLDLDMQGFNGEIVVPCSSGHLHQQIHINGPVLAPTLLIRKATYGAEAPYDETRRR